MASLLLKLKAKDEASQQIKGVTSSLGGMAKGAAAAAVAFAGFKVVKDAIGTFATFEQSMANVKAISGATGATFDALTAQAKKLGETTEFTASQSAEAMGVLARAGFTAQEVLTGVEGVLNAASASGVDLATAADIVASSVRGFGLEASEASRVADILAKTTNVSNTNMVALGESLKFVAPIAKGMGQSIEKTAAMIGILGDAGIKGSMAGTNLRAAFNKLIKPSNDMIGIFARLGVEMTDSEGKTRQLTDIVRELAAAGATTEDIMKSFGPRAGNAIKILVDKGAPALEKLTKTLEGSAGAAEKMREIRLDTITGQMTLLGSAAEGLQINFVEAFNLDSLVKNSIKSVNLMVTAVSDNMAEIQFMTLAVSDTFMELGKFFIDVGIIMSESFRPLLDVFSEIRVWLGQILQRTMGKFIATFGDMLKMLESVPLIGDKFKGVSDDVIAFGEFMVSTAEDSEHFKATTDDIIKSLEAQKEALTESQKALVLQGEAALKAAEAGKKAAEIVGVDSGKDAAGAVATPKKLAGGSIDMTEFNESVASAVSIIQSSVSSFGAGVGSILVTVGNSMKTVGGSVLAAFAPLVGSAIDMIANGSRESFQEGIDSYITTMENFGENLGVFIGVIAENIDEIIIGLITGLVRGVISIAENLPSILISLLTAGFNVFDELLGGALTKVALFIKDYIVFMGELLIAPFVFVVGLINEAFELINVDLGAMFAEWGKLFIELFSSIGGFFVDVFDTIVDGIVSAFDFLMIPLMWIKENIIDPISGPISSILESGLDLLGFADGGSPPVGVPSLVGERGPELFVPQQAGTIIPNDALGGAGGGDTFITIELKGLSNTPDTARELVDIFDSMTSTGLVRINPFTGAAA